jgi:ABC-type dipeptide/oligopeptide/nickel transport system permease subunit
MEYVNAAVTLGATPRRIIFRHILPNALPSIIVVTALNISANIIAEASLSFLGFGDPTEVTWGRILQINSTNYTIAWWTALFPGMAIFITALGFNLLGDGLRDALDPRLRGEVKK